MKDKFPFYVAVNSTENPLLITEAAFTTINRKSLEGVEVIVVPDWVVSAIKAGRIK
jgi:hypothetical protein